MSRPALLAVILALVPTYGVHPAAPVAPPLNLYALSRATATLHHTSLDADTGKLATRAIGPVRPTPPSPDLTGLVALADGHAYTLERRTNRLLTIRLEDGIVTAAAQLDQNVFVSSRGLDIAPDGLLWGVLPGMELRTINPFSGQTMFIAPITGADVIEAIAFSPRGMFYAVGNSGSRFSRRLYTVSTQSGQATHIADLPIPDLDTLTWAGGYLYAADSHGRAADLYRIHPETGELTNMGSTGVMELNGIGAVQGR